MKKINIKKIIALSTVVAFLAVNKDVAIAEEVYTMEEQQNESNEKGRLGKAKSKVRKPHTKISYHEKR